MDIICGYLVVRRPNENFDIGSQASCLFEENPPCIGRIFYSGVSRASWFELDEHYFDKSLPRELVEIRQRIEDFNQPDLDVSLTRDLGEAIRILNYSNSIQNRYEIIALYSEKLEKNKGSMVADVEIDWIGRDVYYSGYGSQIREGIFVNPTLFSEFLEEINDSGLFDSIDLADEYTSRYRSVCDEFGLELMGKNEHELRDVIRVGRVVC